MNMSNPSNSNSFTKTINGVKVTIGFSPTRDYNLSIIKQGHYQVKANGYYNKKKPILDPLDWVKSDEGQKHIKQIYSKTEDIIHLAGYYSTIVYTGSYYVWLGYLKHCIGNIDTAISAEFAI